MYASTRGSASYGIASTSVAPAASGELQTRPSAGVHARRRSFRRDPDGPARGSQRPCTPQAAAREAARDMTDRRRDSGEAHALGRLMTVAVVAWLGYVGLLMLIRGGSLSLDLVFVVLGL